MTTYLCMFGWKPMDHSAQLTGTVISIMQVRIRRTLGHEKRELCFWSASWSYTWSVNQERPRHEPLESLVFVGLKSDKNLTELHSFP